MPTTVRELVRRGTVVDAKTTISDAVAIMDKEGSDTVLVSKEGEIVGLLTERDVIKKVLAKKTDPGEVRAYQVVNPPAVTVEFDTDLRAVYRLMAEKNVDLLPVVENGKIIGIVTEREVAARLESLFIAYVLVKADPGKDEEIHSVIGRLGEVAEAALTYGSYDLIAKIEFEDFKELDDFIFKKVRTIPGVRETTTILTSRS